MEINLQGLIPPVDEAQKTSASIRIQTEIGQVLFEVGRVTISRAAWRPQHLQAIINKCVDRGYIIDDSTCEVNISVPEFDIVEVVIPPIEEPEDELIEYIITEDTDGDDI